MSVQAACCSEDYLDFRKEEEDQAHQQKYAANQDPGTHSSSEICSTTCISRLQTMRDNTGQGNSSSHHGKDLAQSSKSASLPAAFELHKRPGHCMRTGRACPERTWVFHLVGNKLGKSHAEVELLQRSSARFSLDTAHSCSFNQCSSHHGMIYSSLNLGLRPLAPH
jgi:hypothetical protein